MMAEFAKVHFIEVGDTKVTYLADGGGIVEPLALYPASQNEENWQPYKDLFNDDGKFITSIGAFLVEKGDRIIAVDAGIGPVTIDFPGFGPFIGGKYLDSLKETGVSPQDVTDMVFTHMHLDHVGWTTVEADGRRQLTYPQARHLVTAAEWEFWHGGDNPAGPHPEFVQKPLEGRLEMISGGDTIAPGITVISTPGHSPGHISLRLETGADTIYILGDLLHGTHQLAEPDWSVAFDTDADLARQSRHALYPELVKPNTIVAAGHFSNKVFGRITESGGKRAWNPL